MKKPTLLSTIGIGVGSIIGSGWLFASYLTAKEAGTYAFLAWIIGAILVFCLSLLLAEVSERYHERGLFSRLMSISHNKDIGFVFAISNLLGTVAVIPAEASATVQYLSTLLPHSVLIYINHNDGSLAFGGLIFVAFFLLLYALVNWWGIHILARINAIITLIKVFVPVLTIILLFCTSFYVSNFTRDYPILSQHHGVFSAFFAVASGGIFFAFFGFQNIALFASEIDNPSRNIPLALISCIGITALLFLLLQAAFIGAVPPSWLANEGWAGLNLTSPLAELIIVLNLNWFLWILYAGSAICPLGSGIVYMGSGPRGLTGMAREGQMPKFFDKIHPVYHFSRRSLVVICLAGGCMIAFFNSWQKIMMVTSGFQLLSCLGVPVAFLKFRQTASDVKLAFKVPIGTFLAVMLFLLIAYLMFIIEYDILLVVGVMLFLLFLIYCSSFYKAKTNSIIKAFQSTYSVFLFLFYNITLKSCAYFSLIEQENPMTFYTIFVLGNILIFIMLLKQKDYFQS